MSSRTPAVLGAALLLFALAPAGAGAAVSSPQTLSSAGDVIRAFPVVAPDGTARVAWDASDTHRLRLAVRAPGAAAFAAPGTLVDLLADDSFGNAGLDDPGRAIVVTGHRTNGGQASSSVGQIQLADGTFARRTKLNGGTLQHTGVPTLAVNGRGDAIAAWVSYSRTAGEMQVALRKAGETTFGPARTLPGSSIARADQRFSPQVAISPGGHVVIGYEAAGKVFGATGTVASGVGAPVAVGTYRPNYGPLSVAAGDARSVLAWTDTKYVNSTGGATAYKAALTGPSGTLGVGTRFGGPGSDEQPPAIDAPATAVTSNGEALIAVAPNGHLQVATAPAGDSAGALITVAAVGDYTVTPAFAVAPDGAALLTWTKDRNGPKGAGVRSVVQVATRPAGGHFGAPIAVSPSDEEALDPAPALGAGGVFTVAWVQSPQGFGNGNLKAVAGTL